MLDYIKQIAIFIIAEGVVLGIVQNEDYKKFIKMCSGMIMIILIISPLDKIFGVTTTIQDFFYDITNEGQYEELQVMIDDENLMELKGQYEKLLKEQIGEEVKEYGYVIDSVEVTFDENEEDYIGMIKLTLARSSENREQKDKKVSISKISIAKSVDGAEVDSPEVVSIKNFITDTYGVEYERIIVEKY